MIRAVLAAALLGLATSAQARGPVQRVPFIGCPADGQTGPIPAPRSGRTAAVPTRYATELAYYSTKDTGVLAPRGWHCVALYGSNGEFLVVTPDRHRAEEFFKEKPVHIRGSAIQLSISTGGTSGRLSVMPAIVRYFPHYRPFVREMSEMDLDFNALRARPYKLDVIKQRTWNFLRFTTPAGKQGEGTNSRLLPGNLPIEGFRKIVGPADEPDLVAADVRLPPKQVHLIGPILAEAAK